MPMTKRVIPALLMALVLIPAGLLTGCGEEEALSIAFTGDPQAPDPVLVDYPLIYVTRSYALDGDDGVVSINNRSLDVFEPGADLILKARAQPSAAQRSLLSLLGEETDSSLYDLRDLEPDFDGNRLLFSMRGPFDPDADPDQQPRWNIWLYDIATDSLTRVIESDTTAEGGNDRDPHFLPDGRIVFTSDRQRRSRAILLDEGRPQFSALDEDRLEEAFVLHVMNDDGTNIEQLSFNQSHDQDPTVLDSGDIVFSRWDNVPGRDVLSLYQVSPDGTGLQRLYGYHSQDTGRDGSSITFAEPRPLPDGRILVLARENTGAGLGADLLILDTDNYVEHDVPVTSGSGGSGQESPLEDIVNLTTPSPRGRFASAWPLFDGTDRLLVAWSQCRVVEATATGPANMPCNHERLAVEPPLAESPPLYGLWILNLADDTQQPVVAPVEGVAITEGVVMSPRPAPFFQAPAIPDDDVQDLIDRGVGRIHIRSVYDFDGEDTTPASLSVMANPVLTPLAARPASFLRLVKPVSLPDRDIVDIPGTAFGRSQGELMREILGYTTVHPDGSAMVQVPANVPFAISVLNRDGKRITPRHRNWLQVRPGETLQCHGCHTTQSQAPHGRLNAEAPSINQGGPFSGLTADFIVNAGETMAEAFARVNSTPAPALNLLFTDIWTDETQRAPDADFARSYTDLQTPAPVSPACTNSWQASCRISIHYDQHIHPLWAVDRQVFEADGVTLIEDRTCTACHSNTDAMAMAQVPAAQLDLTDGASPDQADHLKSYRELLFGDVEQEVIGGALIDRLVPVFDAMGNQVFERDEDGNLILDAQGNPIPVLRTVNVTPAMSTAGALASGNFFELFGGAGSHVGYLTPAELKLLAEWLDIGAQYYNDPFVVPP